MFSALGAHGFKAQKGIQGHPYNVEQDTDYLVRFEGIQKVLLQMAPTLVLNFWCFLWIEHCLPGASYPGKHILATRTMTMSFQASTTFLELPNNLGRGLL